MVNSANYKKCEAHLFRRKKANNTEAHPIFSSARKSQPQNRRMATVKAKKNT